MHVFLLIDAFGYGHRKRIGFVNVDTSLATFRGYTAARQIGYSMYMCAVALNMYKCYK